MRCLDQTHDPGIGALGGAARGQEIERLPGVRRAAHHWLIMPPLDRDRFARQGRLVENSKAACDGSIDWNDIPLANQEAVAGRYGVELDLFELAAAMANGRTRHAREESGHLSPRSAFGKAFEILAAGIHQGHNHGCQLLAKDQRCAHRERRDDVKAHIASA